MSKTIHIQIKDPSGHERWLKNSEFPWRLGSSWAHSLGFRDATLGEAVLQIDATSAGYTARVIQEGVTVRLGDLKLRDFEIPMGVSLQVGESEWSVHERREAKSIKSATTASELGPWWSVAESGQALLKSVRTSSRSKLSIYLSGETGTGKEVLAKMIHQGSPRAGGAFVAINCGALALSLVESELFGHVKGAFTGALKDRPGALLQAHNGTLFLDEVGDLPLEVQVKLLRFLESGEIRPVGSDRVQFADVRVVCATHKPLAELVKEGKFRQDLYFRIASIPLQVPSLRSRPEDIEYLSQRFCEGLDKSLSSEAILRLKSYAWPGNVRELRHALERACGLSGEDSPWLQAHDFEFLGQDDALRSPDEGLPQTLSLKEMERALLLKALKVSRGNRSEAAKHLGVARSTLFEMLKRHCIPGPRSQVPEEIA